MTASMQKKNCSRPDETREFPQGRVELVTLGGVTFGRATLQPGWKWSTSLKPAVKTNSCEASHLCNITSPAGSRCGWTTAAKRNSARATCRSFRPDTMHGLSETSRR
jgi:hypothetical protein